MLTMAFHATSDHLTSWFITFSHDLLHLLEVVVSGAFPPWEVQVEAHQLQSWMLIHHVANNDQVDFSSLRKSGHCVGETAADFEGTLSSNRITGFVFSLYTGWVLTPH